MRNFHNFFPLCLIKISALRALLSGKSSNSLESDSVVYLTIFHSIFNQTFARWELPSRQSLVFYVNEIRCLLRRGSLAWKSLIFARCRAPTVLFLDFSFLNFIAVLALEHDIACSSGNIPSLFSENDNMPAILHRLRLCCFWHLSSCCLTSNSISFVTWQWCQNQNHLKRK